MTQDITSLIDKLEGAEVGSRELDCRVVAWSEGVIGGEHWSDGDLAYALTYPDRTCNPAPVTTSLDAALALAERVLPGWVWEITILQDETSVQGAQEIWPEGLAAPDCGGVSISLRTPALALCAAILHAQSEAR